MRILRSFMTLICGLRLVAITSAAAQPSDGYVGVYSDAAGTLPCTMVPPYTGTTLYVIAKTAGSSESGITGAEFRIEVTNPNGWFFSYTAPAAPNVVLGNPLDTSSDSTDASGLNINFQNCQQPQ